MVFVPREMMESYIPTTTIIGVVSGKHLHLGANGNLKNVSGSGGIKFKLRSIWANTNHAATAMSQGCAIRASCVDESKIASGEVEPSIHSN